MDEEDDESESEDEEEKEKDQEEEEEEEIEYVEDFDESDAEDIEDIAEDEALLQSISKPNKRKLEIEYEETPAPQKNKERLKQRVHSNRS